LRNDSYIDDLFVGFFKSVTTCPEKACGRESVVFDPFLSVKVPLKSPKHGVELRLVVTAVPLRFARPPTVTVHVTVKKSGSVGNLIEAAASAAGVQRKNCVLAELYLGKVHKFFEDADRVEDITSLDVLVLYELEDAAAFKATIQQRSGEALQPGDVVIVKTPFQSNSKKSMYLDEGLHGRVVKVDLEDDAFIKFDNIDMKQWVFKRNCVNLAVDQNMYSSEQRFCIDDGEHYTFRELLDKLEGQRDLEDIRATWKEEMVPLPETEGDAATTCGAIVDFRDGERRGPCGIPMIFCMKRHMNVCSVVEAIRAELVRRFGSGVDSGWTLHQPDKVLWAGGRLDQSAQAFELNVQERFTLEWADGVPQLISRTLANVPRAEEDGGVSLETCFEWLTEKEQLSKQDEVYCSACKDHRQSFKKVEFWSFPPVLVLQLKRFEYGGAQRRRVSTPVSFPVEGLDLTRFSLSGSSSFPRGKCVRAGQRVVLQGLQNEKFNGLEGMVQYLDTKTARFCVRLREGDPPSEWKRFRPENLSPVASPRDEQVGSAPPVYDLVAVSKHIGNASFGHYVAYARSSVDGMWRLFDDEDVTEVSAQAVRAEQIGAYVLFYIRRDHRPPRWGQPPSMAH